MSVQNIWTDIYHLDALKFSLSKTAFGIDIIYHIDCKHNSEMWALKLHMNFFCFNIKSRKNILKNISTITTLQRVWIASQSEGPGIFYFQRIVMKNMNVILLLSASLTSPHLYPNKKINISDWDTFLNGFVAFQKILGKRSISNHLW